jgi:GNAT superfamily N-acetyltransferase
MLSRSINYLPSRRQTTELVVCFPPFVNLVATNMLVRKANTPEDLIQVHDLLLEYGELRNFDEALGNYREELDQLPGRYAPPDGCLLLACDDNTGSAIGCVAYQKLSEQVCEMKRMFVRPSCQRQGAGQLLLNALIDNARQTGYQHMRLDTHPSMDAAARLYEKSGFAPTERYNSNPTAGIRFFERQL